MMRKLGYFFVIIYLVLLFYKLPRYGIDSAIWYCDWIMLFSGIALIFDREKVLSAFLVQCIIVQVPWLIDAIYYALFSESILGISGYLYQADYGLFALSLRHFLVLPVLLIYFLDHRFESRMDIHIPWFLSTYFFIMAFSLLYSDPIKNTNCAFNPCITIFPTFSNVLVYLAVFFVFLLGVQYLIIRGFERIDISDKKKSKLIIIYSFFMMALITVAGRLHGS